MGLLSSVLLGEGSLARCIGGAGLALQSSQCITRGICKAQALCCEKQSSLFVLTTPGRCSTPILQLRTSKATPLTRVPSLSSVPFLKSHDIFLSIGIIPQCSGERVNSLYLRVRSSAGAFQVLIIAQHLGKVACSLGLHRGHTGRGWRSRIQPLC